MDFNETYNHLYLSEGLDNQDISKTKMNHENRDKQIKMNYLRQKEAERIKTEIEVKADQTRKEIKKRSKFRSILNSLSTK